jgi:hypothetical protein
VSLNFGKRGILDPVEKVARDLLGLESRTSLDRSRKLAEAAAQQAVEGARDHLRGTREPTRLHLGRPVLQVQNCALGLSRIPPFYKFGNVCQRRAEILRAACQAHPERFPRGVPVPPPLPTAAWINKPPAIPALATPEGAGS